MTHGEMFHVKHTLSTDDKMHEDRNTLQNSRWIQTGKPGKYGSEMQEKV